MLIYSSYVGYNSFRIGHHNRSVSPSGKKSSLQRRVWESLFFCFLKKIGHSASERRPSAKVERGWRLIFPRFRVFIPFHFAFLWTSQHRYRFCCYFFARNKYTREETRVVKKIEGGKRGKKQRSQIWTLERERTEPWLCGKIWVVFSSGFSRLLSLLLLRFHCFFQLTNLFCKKFTGLKVIQFFFEFRYNFFLVSRLKICRISKYHFLTTSVNDIYFKNKF